MSVATNEIKSFSKTIIGTTGQGKTNYILLEILSNIERGESSIVFDPHGDLTRDLLVSIPSEYADRVDVLAASEDMPFGLNLFECPNNKSSLARDRVVDNVVQLFKRLMRDQTGFHPHIETLIRKTSYTLLANPKFTMAEIGYLYHNDDTGKAFRSYMCRNLDNPDILSFWDGVERKSDNQLSQYIEPLLNKVTYFTDSDTLRMIVGQEKTTIPFSSYLDQVGKTLIVYMPIGELGREKTSALGMMLLSLLSEQIYERVRQRQERRIPLKIYIDELGLFATSGGAISDLLTQGRKFGAHVISSFQTFAQLPDKEAESAVLQVPSLVIFSVIGGYDADILSKQLKVEDTKPELVPKMRLQPNMKTRSETVWIDEDKKREYEEITPKYKEVSGLRSEYKYILERFGLVFCDSFSSLYSWNAEMSINNYRVLCKDFIDGNPPSKPDGDSQKYEWVDIFKPDERLRRPPAPPISYLEAAIVRSFDIDFWYDIEHVNPYFQKFLVELREETKAWRNYTEVVAWLRNKLIFLYQEQLRLEKETEHWGEMFRELLKYQRSVTLTEQDGWLPIKLEEEHTSKSRRVTSSRRSETISESTTIGTKDIQIYDMVEGQKRTYADLWNEMQKTLATLDPYNCYIQTFNDKKEITETRLVTSPPPPKQPDGEETADHIFERSKKRFGRDAGEVQNVMLKRIAPFLQAQKDAKKPAGKDSKEDTAKPMPDFGDGKPYP